MDVLYAIVDVDKLGEEGEMNLEEQIIESPTNPEEKKRKVALEDLYAIVNKEHKKKQNEDAPPAESNTVDGMYYNTVAIRNEEVAPQISPHTVEKLYTAVSRSQKDNANPPKEP